MSFHHENKEQLAVLIGSDGVVMLIEDRGISDKAYRAHGIIMYSAWSVISLIQITLNRYLRHQWRWKQLAHTIWGTFSLLMTIVGAYLSMKQEGIQMIPDPFLVKMLEGS